MDIKLRRKDNNNSLQAIIQKVIESDYLIIRASGEYSFDWKLERYNDVYKVVLKSEQNDILGLMSLVDNPDEHRIHINLIESGNINKGRNKEIDHIAGCLIGFAIRIALENGYDGLVTLEPKVKLYDHYKNKYGFIDAGYMVLIDGKSAIDLMNKYLK